MNKKFIFKSIIVQENLFNIKELNEDDKWTRPINCPLIKHDDKSYQSIFNIQKNVFECEGCGFKTNNPVNFLSKITGKNMEEAFYYCEKVLDNKIKKEHLVDLKTKILKAEDKPYLKYNQTLKELEVFNYPTLKNTDNLIIPVKINRNLLFYWEINWDDINILHQNKNIKDNEKGLIVPYDLWKKDNNITIITSSFQDMIKARYNGFNAICITGGIKEIPKAFYSDFKDRDVAIAFTKNDSKINFADILASKIIKNTKVKSFRVVNYHSNKDELYNQLRLAKDLIKNNDSNTYIPKNQKQNLEVNLKNKVYNNWFYSDFKTTLTYDETYMIPKIGNWYVKSKLARKVLKTFEKPTYGNWFLKDCSEKDFKSIIIDKKSIEDIIREKMNIYFEDAVEAKIINKQNIPTLKKSIIFEPQVFETVAKAYISTSKKPKGDEYAKIESEVLAYSIGNYRWENSYEYSGLIKFVDHQTKVVCFAKQTHLKEHAWVNFKMNDDVKASLDKFKRGILSIDEKIDKLYLNFKNPKLGGETINKHFFLAYETAFNSVKKFKMHPEFKPTRGVIYNFIIGESGSGKTHCGKMMSEIYGAGEFIDLKNTTAISLIGGSRLVNGEQKKTLGILAQTNGSLAILDESHGAPEDFRKRISVIKADNIIKIVRMDGAIEMEIFVRLVEIANQKSRKPISNYKHGVEIIWEQLGSATEEWRRHDAFFLAAAVLAKDFKSKYDDDYEYLNNITKKDYNNRLKWVWSRNEDDIIFQDGVLEEIDKVAKKIIKKYMMHAQIFGLETNQKIARFSISCAAMLASSDKSYEKIIVKPEHVNWTIKWLLNLYENDLFKIKIALKEEKKYSIITKGDEDVFHSLFERISIVIVSLVDDGSQDRNILRDISGIAPDTFGTLFAKLFKNYMIRKDRGNKYIATPKLMKLYKNYEAWLLAKNFIKE